MGDALSIVTRTIKRILSTILITLHTTAYMLRIMCTRCGHTPGHSSHISNIRIRFAHSMVLSYTRSDVDGIFIYTWSDFDGIFIYTSSDFDGIIIYTSSDFDGIIIYTSSDFDGIIIYTSSDFDGIIIYTRIDFDAYIGYGRIYDNCLRHRIIDMTIVCGTGSSI